MIRSLTALAFLAIPLTGFTSMAQAEDDILRLPGSGELKSEADRAHLKADRLKPGGGLLASFDADGNDRISDAEIQAGIALAFEAADANGDGELTAIEQQEWAANLPTHDDSLANPVRFDPNLDRRVSFAEFSNVIVNLSTDYRKDGHDELRLGSLRAPKEERDDRFPGLIDSNAGTRIGSTDF